MSEPLSEETESTITSESSLDLSVTPDTPDSGTSTALEANDPQAGHFISFIGILLFTFVVYARPYEWSDSMKWLSGSALWIAISSVLVFVLVQLSLGGSIFAEKEAKLVVLLLILSLLSIPFSLDPSLAWNESVDYSKVVLIFIIMASVLRTRLRLKALLLLVLLITIILAFAAVWDFAQGNVSKAGRIEGAIGGMFSNPNDLALHFVTITPIAIGLAWASRNLLAKIFYIIAALLIIAGIVLTFSRGGLLGLIVALGVLVWRLAPQGRLLLLGVLIGFLLLAPVIAGYSDRFSMKESSAVARTDDLKRSIFVALRHPLFGVGMGNYILYSNTSHASHNAYTQVWSEIGVGGLCTYLALILIPLRRLQNIVKVATPSGDNDIKFIAIGLEASIFGYMACSFFASVAFLWYVYYLIAFAISARRLASLLHSENTPVSYSGESTEKLEAFLP